MGWGKALSAVVVMSISVMLVVSVLPVGAAPGSDNGKKNSPLMMMDPICSVDDGKDKCPVFIDRNGDEECNGGDKVIWLPKKVAMGFRSC